jgi:hypothetical protein
VNQGSARSALRRADIPLIPNKSRKNKPEIVGTDASNLECGEAPPAPEAFHDHRYRHGNAAVLAIDEIVVCLWSAALRDEEAVIPAARVDVGPGQ